MASAASAVLDSFRLKRHSETIRPTALFIALLLFLAPTTAVQAEMGRKDVVYINGTAKEAGQIVFSFNRTDKDPIEIVVQVPKGARAKRVNQDVARRFDREVPGDQFIVNTKDERKVRVEGRTKNNLFELVVTNEPPKGLTVTVRDK